LAEDWEEAALSLLSDGSANVDEVGRIGWLSWCCICRLANWTITLVMETCGKVFTVRAVQVG